MTALKRLFTFLSSLWGLLAVAALAFPGATALLKVPIAVDNSTIAPLYPVIGTIVSAFATLFLVAYKQDLGSLLFARKLAIWGMAVGLVCFFAFVSVRLFLLDVSSAEIRQHELGQEVRTNRAKGRIQTQITHRDGTQSVESRGDPFDVLGLFLFAGTFASLTFGFTALGIHAYQQKDPEPPG
ncbi:hypothetical protein DXK93_00190 [Achromobacter sp. K91]|uniref:hypothetical protein n=1 Tax=Achromobacter sp. K91 TaxID=2292262 RepID=UPI000E66D5B2|nr:hypothetical protein [Achromobacter sp. K91]RIJ06227.1 hypothetical protein DXK93_00190 [Achromobacter sp. K91]